MDDRYVLISPARNEEKYIENTLTSVVNQSLLPVKWIIVSDGSTDRTDDIVMRYAERHEFIDFMRLEPNSTRNFSSKIDAFQVGYKKLENMEYSFIGNLDADIAFKPTYYRDIVKQFHRNPKLGVAGGQIVEFSGGKKQIYFQYMHSVPGAIHLFRRDCYEEIGGFLSLPEGGYDAVAEAMAKMKGWEVRTFKDIEVVHLKGFNVACGNIVRATYQLGRRDYLLGNLLLFESLKCIYRVFESPLILGSLLRFFGYLSCYLGRKKPAIPADVCEFIQNEQKNRLSALFPFGRRHQF